MSEPEPPEAPRPPRTLSASSAEIADILRAAGRDSFKRVSDSTGAPLSASLRRRRWPWSRKQPTSLEEVVLADHDLDVRLKALVARWSVGAMIGQLVVADGVFVLYAWLGRDWDIEPAVILGWLSATVVEVIGIVVIVARYLFPKDGHRWSQHHGG
ncbi:hypothetical protein [Frigoribacterium sp. MCBA15_019]|uniref:hypothetical protein n=1 Tax=Frigoribacterium sp. MCBA15_019 TaxID=1898745 RepID=UPI0008DD4000|nr:hypothetical protein [Frigoribacterium sp. MCBA15_019]OII27569.1 hypothetical protein BIV04_03270 [Frigoribacterium sp. MCBA15_019]